MKVSPKFALLLITFYFGDLLSTYYMLSNGWYETNPLGVYGMIIVKTILIISIYYFTPYLESWRPYDKSHGLLMSYFFHGFLITGGIYAILNNYGVLL